jgi:hypothetical protein
MNIEINKDEIERVLTYNKWDFGNKVLYNMCQENPLHNDADVIVGKLWIIGRSYAAAIERRKNVDEDVKGDNFYFDVVAPNMLKIADELDDRICKLKQYEHIDSEIIKEIISLHKFLMDTFYTMTGMEKRSLASKYLHFHLPKLFYIYDSRAEQASTKLCKANGKILAKKLGVTLYDDTYVAFLSRIMQIEGYIKEKYGISLTPRQLDAFLLNY